MAQKQTFKKRFLQHFPRKEQSKLSCKNDCGQIITETLILLIFMVGFLAMIGSRIKDQEKDLDQFHFLRGHHESTKNF